jgi:predicted acetyltransferase
MAKLMPDAPEQLGLTVEVVPANPDDQPLLAGLLNSYAREFSQFHPVEFEADGSFIYRQLSAYWQESGRFPFFIRVDGILAGFAFVTRVDSPSGGDHVFDIAEFYVSPPFRRHGAGTAAAHILWKTFPARWQVRVLQANKPAMRFWQNAVTRFTGQPARPVSFTVEKEAWLRFTFDSRIAAP